jgi:hypothetical protein
MGAHRGGRRQTSPTARADDGYSSQKALEEVQRLGVKLVSISGAKGKRLLEAQWKSRPYRQARAERSAMESRVFTLKESFERRDGSAHP